MSSEFTRASAKCEVPDRDGAIFHRSVDVVSVGVPGQIEDAAGCLEGMGALAHLDVPHFEGFIFTGEGDVAVVLAPLEMPDRLAGDGDVLHHRPGARDPDLEIAFLSGRGEVLAVMTQRKPSQLLLVCVQVEDGLGGRRHFSLPWGDQGVGARRTVWGAAWRSRVSGRARRAYARGGIATLLDRWAAACWAGRPCWTDGWSRP